MNHFLTIGEYSPETIQSFIDTSELLHSSNEQVLTSKNIAFIFEKPSLRTKVGTEAAINHLGGNVIHVESDLVLSSGKAVPFSCRESLNDAMKNLSLWCDAVFARVYSHQTLQKMTKYGSIPVVNALCDEHHPMQALADLYTLQQKFGKEEKLTISFVGDANNVSFSLTEIALKFGHTVHFSAPEKYSWTQETLNYFSLLEVEHKGTFKQFNDPFEAVFNADAVYTDTFISMGEEHLYEDKINHFKPYQINEKLFNQAGKDAVFMHCLPAHRGIEVTDGVIDHPNSLVYKQAENRMVVSKGVFASLLNGEAKEIKTNGTLKVPL
ncbi:MAG: ornithine carbamoyltransferase [Balneolaceae bacterium]